MSFEEIFDESYNRVLLATPENTEFFEAFYQRFLRSSPEVRQLFRNTDMAGQRRMLKKSFFSLVAFYASGAIDNVLRRIAYIHSARELNIKPYLYDLWLECLIDTVKAYDPECRDEVELAWRLILSPGITYMKFGYDHF
ncbi:globin [Marinobacter nanhaiticus D15-8W]|uniref:Globin n=1 Tax=Marinobacter nanhaiticus D15-8W TaxID=626887 RepID=N6WNX8_9GAMM|nr:globin [Marinobacter nanhaiticus]ENO12727.1 globin [Marinobacter nanhaiticus D15-8W]BES70070.1 globin [Marinobacter nanhaiticus D15-8W]